jgi:hypothetical protein
MPDDFAKGLLRYGCNGPPPLCRICIMLSKTCAAAQDGVPYRFLGSGEI